MKITVFGYDFSTSFQKSLDLYSSEIVQFLSYRAIPLHHTFEYLSLSNCNKHKSKPTSKSRRSDAEMKPASGPIDKWMDRR